MSFMKTGMRVAASVGFVAAAVVSCAPGGNLGSNGETPGAGRRALNGGAHIMPMHPKGAKKTFSAPSGAHLTYRGGPVLANVKVVTVFWGSGVEATKDVNQFYSDITVSPYFDWLTEYNTPTQKIGHGSLAGSYVDASPPGGTTIDDSQVQAEIGNLIAQGKVPPNDGNTIYMVHFPPGVSITMGGSSSCSTFCAYHGSFTAGGKSAFYGVLPDLGGACDGGCGGGSKLQNTTSVASHELIEAVTDADVGAGNLAWYDDSFGEIGDICNAQQGVVSGWTIQLEYSNTAGDCIATQAGGGTTGSSTTSAGAGGSSGSGGVGGSTGVGGSPGVGGSTGVGGSPGGGGNPGGGGSPGGGTCGHDICSMGSALDPSCDACANLICTYDSFCCTQAWDDQCLGEVGCWCGLTCQ